MKFYPLVPNWSSPLKEVYEFKTSITEARDGTEQRRALRNSPRVSISFQSIADGERRRDLEHLLQTDLGQVIHMPNYVVHVPTTTALPATGNVVTVQSIPSWLTEGATVALCARRNVVTLEVEDIAGLTITFATTTSLSWPVGTKIRPLLEGRLKTSQSQSLVTNTVAQVPLTFDVTPGIYSYDDTADDKVMLGDYEVLLVKPNWGGEISVEHTRRYDEVDYGFGRTTFYSPVDYANRVVQANYTNRDAEATEWMKRFFLRQKGMRGEFYAPSWTDDMTLVSAVSGQNYITVAGRVIYDSYSLSATNRAFVMKMEDGTWKPFEVEIVSLVGNDTRIELDAPLTQTITPSQVKQIHWLYRTRFATDTLTVEWTTDQTSRLGYEARSLGV